MVRWLRAQFAAFARSYDHASMMAASTPAAILLAAGSMTVVFAALGYLPPLASAANLRHPWVALILTGMASVSTYTAWRHRCRGRVGTSASLVDNSLYLAAMAYAATHTTPSFGVGLSVVYAIALIGGTVQLYSLTLPLVCALAIPLGVLLVSARPGPPVSLILIGGLAVGIAWAYMNGYRKRLLERQAQLEQALGAADRAAEESMQAALASMLLTLGNFLHELRNNQTAIAANLAFLEEVPELDSDAREALQDAKQAQAAEGELVRQAIDQLRGRAQPVSTKFLLGDLLQRVIAELETISAAVKGSEFRVEIAGNPEHLRSVLVNLARNAAQAGATLLQFALTVEPSGRAVRLAVHDNGPGIPPSRRERLFRPFTETTKADGTGLGLYLCRRYVGLLGGSLSVEDGPLGGASFIVLLPARVLGRSPASNPSPALPARHTHDA